MKKFMFVLGLFSFLFLSLDATNSCFAAEKEYFAKVETSGVQFYSSKDDLSALFELPATYFVKASISNDAYLHATYKNLNGYVKKELVSLMKGTPSQPYVNATFKVFVSNYLYSNPSQASSTTIDISTSDILSYYGTKNGQQLNSQTNVWYFASVEKNGQTFFGYVFSGITDYLTNIPQNTETFELVKDSDLSDQTETPLTKLSTKTKILLIISIAVPSVLILYFLIKPSRISISANKNKNKKTHRKIRHGDYYEFDENEL